MADPACSKWEALRKELRTKLLEVESRITTLREEGRPVPAELRDEKARLVREMDWLINDTHPALATTVRTCPESGDEPHIVQGTPPAR